MRRYGWSVQFNVDGKTFSNDQQENWYNTVAKLHCGDAKWYGWNYDRNNINSAGVLKTLLKGSGEFRLDFGNCGNNGVVKVYLDGRLISFAPRVTSRVITHDFTPGSMLEIKDEGMDSIVNLNSFAIICNGKWSIVPHFVKSTILKIYLQLFQM